jgi:riboflavin synthase
MFTGIVEELGRVRSIDQHGDGASITIEAGTVLSDATIGASVAVNGCCLTVIEFSVDHWVTDAVPETLDRTNLGRLVPGDRVNLERPLAVGGRYGGHVVQGHVDGVGTVMNIVELDDGSRRFTFAVPPELARYVVEKGSIALDGISLTVASVDETRLDVAVIPHTLAVTTLGRREVGDTVNVETDILGKYVERLLQAGATDLPRPTTTGDRAT